MSVVGAGLVIGMGFLTWSTANANCTEVGAGNGTAALAFRDAFDAAGGAPSLDAQQKTSSNGAQASPNRSKAVNSARAGSSPATASAKRSC